MSKLSDLRTDGACLTCGCDWPGFVACERRDCRWAANELTTGVQPRKRKKRTDLFGQPLDVAEPVREPIVSVQHAGSIIIADEGWKGLI